MTCLIFLHQTHAFHTMAAQQILPDPMFDNVSYSPSKQQETVTDSVQLATEPTKKLKRKTGKHSHTKTLTPLPPKKRKPGTNHISPHVKRWTKN